MKVTPTLSSFTSGLTGGNNLAICDFGRHFVGAKMEREILWEAIGRASRREPVIGCWRFAAPLSLASVLSGWKTARESESRTPIRHQDGFFGVNIRRKQACPFVEVATRKGRLLFYVKRRSCAMFPRVKEEKLL